MRELTQLGKFLRKLRIDRNELLKDMAIKLGVAISFLSSVENGKKSMPTEWAAKLCKQYNLTEAQQRELDFAIANSENGVDVKFEGMSEDKKELSVAFARKIMSMPKHQQDLLKGILF